MRKFTTPKEWSDHLDAQLASEKTVKSYCHDNGLNLSSFYRQRRKRSQGEPESQGFVRAPGLPGLRPGGSSVSIRVRDLTLTLEPGFSSDELERVLFAVRKAQHVQRSE